MRETFQSITLAINFYFRYSMKNGYLCAITVNGIILVLAVSHKIAVVNGARFGIRVESGGRNMKAE
jgi:hypothetical protein